MEDIKKMYAEDLRALAVSKGIPGADGMKKADLIAALEAAPNESDEPDESAGQPDREEILFRRFGPGSAPVEDGRPAYTPDPDPQEGEPDPPDPAAAPRPAAEKVGEPIGRHRSPAERFKAMAADVDSDMSAAEREALKTLAKAGWTVMLSAKVESAYTDRLVRSFRVAGVYDVALARKKRGRR